MVVLVRENPVAGEVKRDDPAQKRVARGPGHRGGVGLVLAQRVGGYDVERGADLVGVLVAADCPGDSRGGWRRNNRRGPARAEPPSRSSPRRGRTGRGSLPRATGAPAGSGGRSRRAARRGRPGCARACRPPRSSNTAAPPQAARAGDPRRTWPRRDRRSRNRTRLGGSRPIRPAIPRTGSRAGRGALAAGAGRPAVWRGRARRSKPESLSLSLSLAGRRAPARGVQFGAERGVGHA